MDNMFMKIKVLRTGSFIDFNKKFYAKKDEMLLFTNIVFAGGVLVLPADQSTVALFTGRWEPGRMAGIV